MALWGNAPRVEAQRIAGAAVDVTHVLHVSLHYSDDADVRYRYPLTGAPRYALEPADPADTPPLLSNSIVQVPPLPLGSKFDDDRFAVGDSLELGLAMTGLSMTSLGSSHICESVPVPDRGVDWRAPSNYGRVLVTVPAAAIDVVTFPIQLIVFLYLAKTHQIG